MNKFNVLENWLDNVAYSHSRSEGTRANYSFHMKRFCEFVGKSPEQIVEEYESADDDKNFKRRYAQIVRNLIGQLHAQDYTDSSISVTISAIRSFFKYNDLPLAFVPTAKKHTVYHNRDIERKEINEVLKVAHPRDRAFFAVMAQSGLRPDTICHLRMKHVEKILDNDTPIPCKIAVPQEIAKGQYRDYFTFIEESGVRHLKDYLKTRTDLNADSLLFTAHGHDVKPLRRDTISNSFRYLVNRLRKKGIMKFESRNGKPSEVRLYTLRKFFRKYAGQAGSDYVNFWMGHTLGVDDHYFSHDVEFHRKIYAEKASPHLRLEMQTPTETEKAIEELRKEHAEKIADLEKQNAELKARLNGFQMTSEQTQELLKRIERLEKAQKQK